MSEANLTNFARKMYFEDDFYLQVCRNPDKAIAAMGGDTAFSDEEMDSIRNFSLTEVGQTSAAIDTLGGGGIIDLGNGGCGVWC